MILGMGLYLQAGRKLDTPVITGAGTITATNLGNPDGEVYSVTGDSYTGGTATYQWLRNDVDIVGATNATYTASKANDSAKTLKRKLIVTSAAGSVNATTAGQLLSWVPQNWVENSGTAAMSRDGAFGSNGTGLEFVIMLKDPSIASVKSYWQVRDTRVSINTSATPNTGTWRTTLKDTAGTTLVDWSSTAGISNTGIWLYHVAASLTGGTPTMVVTRWQITNGVAGAAETVAGSFATGPVAGTIDFARTGTGTDQFLLSSTGLTNLANAEIGYIGIWQNAPHAPTSFVNAAGIVIDPATIGSPVGLFYSPAASFTTNHGSGGDFTVSAGTFTDT